MKRDEQQLLRYLLAHENQAPHAMAYSRRQLFRLAGKYTLGASALAALLAACGSSSSTPSPTTAAAAGTSGSAAASPGGTGQLPELTSIPDNLKGSGEVRVASYGGAFQEAQRKAYFEPFQKLSGIKVVESEGPDPAKVKAMVDTKNVEWDVAEFSRASVINLQKKGDYWEPINYDLVDTANIDKAFQYKYALDMLPYGQIYAYRSDVFTDPKPSGWADFWDAEKFKGARAMPGGSGGLTPDLEAALMASGVPADPAQIYPIDIDKAYESLSKIKSEVVKWWDAGAIPAQMLADKEAELAVAWNGRIAAIQDTGSPVEISWNQGELHTDCWAVPKGAPNAENAMKFTAFITLPISQARLSMLIPYGFVNDKATDYIPADRLQVLPTAPDIKKNMLIVDYQWWADNRDKVLEKWNSWILS